MSDDSEMKCVDNKQIEFDVVDSDEFANLDEAEKQEYEELNSTLDQISSYLDALEQQNDNLNSQLRDLLESSRQARKELCDTVEKEDLTVPEK